jgi:polyisoprenoid-binding protein YceI
MTTWQLDPDHSTVAFAVRHMMVGTTRGSFRTVTLDVEFDPEAPELGHVVAVIDAASIDTGSEQRDAHLRSAEFLDVTPFPTITFTSSSVDKRGYGEYGLHGDLTIHGVAQPIVLDVAYRGAAANPMGGHTAGFTAHGRLNRRQFGLVWNVPMDAGGVLVGEEVKIDIELELTQAADAPVAAPDPVLAGAA